jgi:hypothetical protein
VLAVKSGWITGHSTVIQFTNGEKGFSPSEPASNSVHLLNIAFEARGFNNSRGAMCAVSAALFNFLTGAMPFGAHNDHPGRKCFENRIGVRF